MPGQWIGPYQFAQMDTAGETSLAEIAHAAVLPPAVGEGLSGPRVILWCRQRSDQEDYEQFWTQSRTFVWSPRTPSSVTEIPFAPEQPGARRAVADKYDALFADIDAVEAPTRTKGGDSAWHLYSLKLNLDKV